MIRLVLLGACLAALVVPPRLSRAAEVEAWPCLDCSPLQLREAAVAQGLGRHYFYDFASGDLAGFEVARPGFAGLDARVASALKPALGLQQSFQRLRRVRAELGRINGIVIELGVEPGDPVAAHSAFDVASASSVRNQISDWLRANALALFMRAGLAPHTAADLDLLLHGAHKVYTQGEELHVTVRLGLTDGSLVAFEFKRHNLIEWWPQYLAGSARDRNDNAVIEPGQALKAGTEFRFPRDRSLRELRSWHQHSCLIVRCAEPEPKAAISACRYSEGEMRCVIL